MTDKKNVRSYSDPDLAFDLGFHVSHLLEKEAFFANISRHIIKTPNLSIPTLGVRFAEDRMMFEMLYNPKFLAMLLEQHGENLGMDLVRAVLMHELFHCALGHVTSRYVENVPHQILNVVQDWAINSLPNMIDLMRKLTWEVPGKFDEEGKPLIGRPCLPEQENLPNGEAFEWYLNAIDEKLKQKAKEQGQGQGTGQSGSGEATPGDAGSGTMQTHDDHGGHSSAAGEDSSGPSQTAREIAHAKMRDIVQKAQEEADKSEISGSGGWGTVPQHMRKEIRKAFKQPLDPKAVLRYFIKTSERADRRSSITKINKRWKYIHPGKRWNRRPKIAISMDMSGSVSDEMLTKFFSWLNEFANFADFTVIPFDHQVFEDKVFVWKKGQKKPAIRVLCGGTNFDAPTEYVNDRDFDGHLILTDLEAPTPKRSKCQRMWVTTEACMNYQRSYFQTKEKILAVDKKF